MSSNERDTTGHKPVSKSTSAITPIQNYMMSTFVRLRVWVGIVGLVFPFVLWGGGHLYQIPLAPSMSAYYHATADCYDPKHNEGCPTGDLVKGGGPMRNTFVGLLFVIGAVMLFMKGFSYWEDVALDIAGVAAALVALNPMPWERVKSGGFPIHSASAFTFFVCLAFVCWFCSSKTLKYFPVMPDRDKKIAYYKLAYRVCGIAMVTSPLTALFFTINSKHTIFHFWIEALGIMAFGVFWLIKTTELRLSDVERKVLKGEIHMDAAKIG
ncbi:hypothetical protein EDE15_3922 [Edaphobacter aggregans]|uniref:Frag1/DRAM/Sfk1 family protein n=1 Tax=Edaphobacter aggregans TaxID=570835 RepID=A0A3R9QD12_9BACT|nr:hypothetical protein [Edaphobacter aggregans]RSL18355.1 hypothetical protein EDE15_3922 [Edaphobacter aggregans]